MKYLSNPFFVDDNAFMPAHFYIPTVEAFYILFY
jgi:hypothetical protein